MQVIFLSKMSYEQCPGCIDEVDDNQIKAIINVVHHSIMCEIALKLISHCCIEKHFAQIYCIKELNLWVPHEF